MHPPVVADFRPGLTLAWISDPMHGGDIVEMFKVPQDEFGNHTVESVFRQLAPTYLVLMDTTDEGHSLLDRYRITRVILPRMPFADDIRIPAGRRLGGLPDHARNGMLHVYIEEVV